MENTKEKHASLAAAFAMLAMISIVFYAVCRTVIVSYAQYSVEEKVFGFFFLGSELYVMLHSFAYVLGIYRLYSHPVKKHAVANMERLPAVSILIPARHEPQDILEATVVGCYNQSYPPKTIYILDDSSEQKYKDEAEELAQRYDCKLFRRETRHGAKAGVINDCLKGIDDPYIAIFDVDQNPVDGFLFETISILESDTKLAFVQTPQYYSNLQYNKIALAANMQQAVFYEHICEAKSADDAMMCCGTNVVFRRQALNDVGGFDESTVTEDLATSLRLHLKGWKALYHNHVSTFGKGPENLGAYLCQQNRWAMGCTTVFKKTLKALLCSPLALRPLQWWEYLIGSSYYLSSWGYLFLIFCPILYIFFNIPSFFMNPIIYGLCFLPYLILSKAIFHSQMKIRNYDPKQMRLGQLLFFLAMPTYLIATLFGLMGIRRSFKITAKDGSTTVPYIQLWPQLLLWAIHLVSIAWAINRFVHDFSPAVLVNTIWMSYHFAMFSSIFYFNR